MQTLDSLTGQSTCCGPQVTVKACGPKEAFEQKFKGMFLYTWRLLEDKAKLPLKRSGSD